jgi:hypothetical protein
MGSTHTTGLTPSKSRQRNGSSCFTEGGTARTGVARTAVALAYQNIGPVGGDEVLVTGKDTIHEMEELAAVKTPPPGRKEVQVASCQNFVLGAASKTNNCVGREF